jgi:hypothetical protein
VPSHILLPKKAANNEHLNLALCRKLLIKTYT